MKPIQVVIALAIATIALLSSPNTAQARPAHGEFIEIEIETQYAPGWGTSVELSFNSTKTCVPKVSLYRVGDSQPIQVKTLTSGSSHSVPFLINELNDFYFKIEGVGGNPMKIKITQTFKTGPGSS